MKNFLMLVLFVASALLLTISAQAQLIIANPSVKAPDISKSDLRDVFTGSTSSLKDGSHVIPALLKSGAANDEFLAAFIGKSDSAFKASWRSLVFSGQATMPKTIDSEAAMIEFIAHTPGAIGYISKTTPHEGVKVLAVR